MVGERRERSELEMYETAPNGYRDGLRAITSSQFSHNTYDVSLHGLLRNRELRSDVTIAIPVRQSSENIHFPF